MSTMKPKVYGKKSRLAAAAKYVPLASSSPEAKSTSKDRPVLAERPSNINITTAYSPLKTKIVRKDGPIQPSSPIDHQFPTKTKARRKKEEADDNVPAPSTLSSDALAASLQNLQIDSPPPGKSDHLPSEPSKVPHRPSKPPRRRSIPKQPASLSSSTLTYLSPLLSLKTVSPVVQSFSTWLATLPTTLSLSKIGEGSFGEVYRATTTIPSPSQSHPSTAILKLIPLAPPPTTGTDHTAQSLTSVQSATSELLLLAHMQRIPGFVHYRGAVVLKGGMPSLLRKLWTEYKASGRTVDTPDPNRKSTAWSRGQLWLMVEMEDAGTALEDIVKGARKKVEGGERGWKVAKTWQVWWEVVNTVARGEWWAGFEHRDLHLGNICLRESEENEILASKAVRYERGTLRRRRGGLEITIIDYSLSRAELSAGRVLAYDLLSDKELLAGEGDLQYDIYRSMARVFKDTSTSHESFSPETNLLWLWYLLNQLLGITRDVEQGSSDSEVGNVDAAPEEASMRQALEELERSLNRERIDEWEIGSVEELVELGIEKGWITDRGTAR